MNFLPDNLFKELNFNFVVIIFGPHLGSIYILELSFMLGSNSESNCIIDMTSCGFPQI